MVSGDNEKDKVKSIERPMEVSHPLRHKWALWHLKSDRSKKWEDCLKEIAVVDTIEKLWGLYLATVPASYLSIGNDYYFFKDGIKPMWEEPMNVGGGRWIIKKLLGRGPKLDDLWLQSMILLVSGQLEDENDLICGVAVNIRRAGDKVALWTSNAFLEQENHDLAHKLLAELELPMDDVYFEIHRDASDRQALYKNGSLGPRGLEPKTPANSPAHDPKKSMF